MKLKRFAFLLTLTFIVSYGCKKENVNPVTPPTSATFEKKIGGPRIDAFYSMQSTDKNEFVFCGFTENHGATERDIYVVKTNENGDIIWFNTYSDDYTDQGWFINSTDDKGYIIAATSFLSTQLFLSVPYDGQLLKIDSHGNQLWKKNYSFGLYTHFSSVEQTNDGGFIVCGTNYEYPSYTGFLLKIDNQGNEIWSKVYANNVSLNQVISTNTNGFIACGTIDKDIFILRTNNQGDTVWTKVFGDAYTNSAKSIVAIDSSFYICGYNTSTPSGASGFVQAIDDAGNLKWYQEYRTYQVQDLEYINKTKSDILIVAGGESFSSNSKAAFLKIDPSNGNVIEHKSYGLGHYNNFSEVHETIDGYFILAGYTLDSGNGDGYIVKSN